MNFGAELNICALKAPTSQSPKPLCDTLAELTAKTKLSKIFWTLFVHFKK